MGMTYIAILMMSLDTPVLLGMFCAETGKYGAIKFYVLVSIHRMPNRFNYCILL